MEAPALVFIGFMGAGKTTGARAAAAALGVRAIDTDRELEQRLGTSIEDYFASHGERAFREIEEDVVAEVLETPPAPVISIGGGAIGSARVRELLARHTVVMLDVDEATAWRRAGGKRRPLARDRERFAALHAERAPIYEALADAVLLDGGAETVRRAAGALRRIPTGVQGPVGGRGRAQLPGLRRRRARRRLLAACAVAASCSPTLPSDALYGDQIPERGGPLRDAAGGVGEDAGDRRDAAARAWRSAGMDHDDHVVALGGGVVGDVAGFCAAVYQRGVGVVQVPTTLVAQVDSAYGGKTGVDLPGGQELRRRLPPAARRARRSADARDAAARAELAAGWAEVIKTALIAGGPLWARVRRGEGIVDRDLVLACARTKLAVVARDERDAGRRQVLNLGHTVGHAIETATGYARYRHGEAVGLGLLAALTLSGQPDLRGEVADLLSGHGLPTTLDPDVDHDAVLAAVQRDKKRRGGRVGFVLVEAPGDVRTGRARGRARRPRGAGGAAMKNRVAVLHGINLGALDRRPAQHYGGLTFTQLEQRIGAVRARAGPADRASSSPTTRASSSRSCTSAGDYADGLLLNPGAWTHYAWALRDAVEISGLPAIEVHLSDVDAREPWRHVSVLEDVRAGKVSGKGVDGYREALVAAEGGLRDEPRRPRRGAPGGRRRAARHRAGEPALRDGLHRLQRVRRGRPGRAPLRHRLPLRRAGQGRGAGLRPRAGAAGAARARSRGRSTASRGSGSTTAHMSVRDAPAPRRAAPPTASSSSRRRASSRTSRAVKEPGEILRIGAAAALVDEIYALAARVRAGRADRARGRDRARARDAPARRLRPVVRLDRRLGRARRAAARDAARRGDRRRTRW